MTTQTEQKLKDVLVPFESVYPGNYPKLTKEETIKLCNDITNQTPVSSRLRELAEEHRDELWKQFPKLAEWIYYTIGYVESFEELKSSGKIIVKKDL